MKSAEITDVALEQMSRFKFVRLNFAGGDMVGHFGEMIPTTLALEAIDLQLSRLAARVDELGGMLIITADHGNAEELEDSSGHAKTSHTTNPVPCIFYDNTVDRHHYSLSRVPEAGLANLASTIALLLGHQDYPKVWQPPLISLDKS